MCARLRTHALTRTHVRTRLPARVDVAHRAFRRPPWRGVPHHSLPVRHFVHPTTTTATAAAAACAVATAHVVVVVLAGGAPCLSSAVVATAAVAVVISRRSFGGRIHLTFVLFPTGQGKFFGVEDGKIMLS